MMAGVYAAMSFGAGLGPSSQSDKVGGRGISPTVYTRRLTRIRICKSSRLPTTMRVREKPGH